VGQQRATVSQTLSSCNFLLENHSQLLIDQSEYKAVPRKCRLPFSFNDLFQYYGIGVKLTSIKQIFLN